MGGRATVQQCAALGDIRVHDVRHLLRDEHGDTEASGANPERV